MDRLATHYMLEEGEWSWKEAAKQQADSLSTVSTDAFEMQAPKPAIHGLKWNNYITKLYGPLVHRSCLHIVFMKFCRRDVIFLPS